MSLYLKISRFFLFLAPLAVVLVTPQTLFPFIVGKYSFFRAMVDLSLIFLMIAWARGEINIDWRNFKKPIAVGVALWVLVFLLASFFAYDPWAAFWGNFERGESGVQLLHLFIFFFLLTVLLRHDEDWAKYVKMILFASFLVVLYGFLAGRVNGFVGPAFSLSTRFQGSLGNPDYTGQFTLFTLFFTLYSFLMFRKAKVFYAVLVLLFFVMFLWSQTRGAFLGFVAGVFFVLVFLSLFWSSKKGRLVFALLLLLMILGIFAFIDFRHSDFVRNLPLVGRFADISLEAGRNRIFAWYIALQGILERPLLGWGPENFSVVFDKYFIPDYFDPFTGGESWFDRAHSVIFDYGAETGILGLAAYLGLWIFYYRQFFEFLRSKKEKVEEKGNISRNIVWATKAEIVLFAIFFAMPFIYIVTGATLFDVLPIYIMLFTFLAFSNHYFKWFGRVKNTTYEK